MSEQQTITATPPESPDTEPQSRRRFGTELAAALTGALVVLVPLVSGVTFLLHPLLRRRKAATGGDAGNTFVKVGTTAGLTPGGPPQLYKVRGGKQDAWTRYPETDLGAVYVRQLEDGSLSCFNARCPHLGCSVNFKSGTSAFVCPCHDSSFSLDGERSNDIPPRDMDPLTVEIRNDNEVWVKFQNFRAGTSERVIA